MNVGRIVASVTIENAVDLSKTLRCDALVDTGASHMVLPSAWKDRLGKFEGGGKIEVETSTQEMVTAEVCGPVRIQIEGFRPIFSEVAFVDMKPANGEYEPLIGYIVLEQSLAGVDVISHRLVHIKHFDLKCFTSREEAQANLTREFRLVDNDDPEGPEHRCVNRKRAFEERVFGRIDELDLSMRGMDSRLQKTEGSRFRYQADLGRSA
jgi:predicted aspartyl protease